jgi:ADP-ribosylglycohydrolase
MLQQVISVGGDTDTNASIAGQIGGAWLGWERLPQGLIEQVLQRQDIEAIAREFASVTIGSGELSSMKGTSE